MRPPFFVLALALYPQTTLSTDEFTFSCLPLTIQRSDPIMSPGQLSSHTHVVVGGTAFQRRMTADTARNAKDTTCGVAIDRSNYWVPQLYHQTGRGYEMIPMESSSIYYFNRACNYTARETACPKERAIAPPAGLRMVAGDSSRRTYNASRFDQRAISHMCIHADGGSSETKAFPQRRCAKLRSQVFMPSCWDGKRLDSADHVSHMAYPAIGDYNKGVCPPSHPIAIYSIFLEFIYDTSRYPEYRNWVYSNGDATGFGLHGDFIHGWTDQPALEKAAATCTGPKGLSDLRCSITKTQKAIAPARHRPEVAAPGDEVGQHGPLQRLPGDNPVG